MKVWIHGPLPLEGTLAGVDLLVTTVSPLRLEVDEVAKVFSVPVCTRAALFSVVELCCGMGGFSSTAERLGFVVRAGVDQNERWKALFESLHTGAVFQVGDLMDSAVLHRLMGEGLFHGIVISGIACQPHSVLGDRKGMADPRSASLPKTLQVAWLLQAAVVVLECTPEILRDAQAQEVLRLFVVSTGYRTQQVILKLSNTWCTKRDRWIAILTAPVIQACELQDMPQGDTIQVVRDLIPEFTLWHQFDHDLIALNLYELSKYYQYAAGGIDNAWIQMDGKLPTLLHSAGNQMYTCACGCRAALSEHRLSQRGLIGVLISLGTSQQHMNICMRHARYLHPLEMWVLMGGSPQANMGHNLRLAMAGVGQAVSPLMGLWTFAHVRRALDLTFDITPCEPRQVLQVYMTDLIKECRIKWPIPVAPTVDEPTLDDPIEDPDDVALPAVTLSRPGTGEPDVQIRLSEGATGAQLLAAETALGNCVSDFRVRVDGEFFDCHQPLPQSALVSIVPAQWDPAQLYAQPTIPCCLNADEFLKYVRASDASAPGPNRFCRVAGCTSPGHVQSRAHWTFDSTGSGVGG